jgi:hypothetical protein
MFKPISIRERLIDMQGFGEEAWRSQIGRRLEDWFIEDDLYYAFNYVLEDPLNHMGAGLRFWIFETWR